MSCAGSKEAAPRFSLVDSAHHSRPNDALSQTDGCMALAERAARSLSTAQGLASPGRSAVRQHSAHAMPQEGTQHCKSLQRLIDPCAHSSSSQTVYVTGPGALSEVRTAADYLHSRRTYRGLEAPCTGAEERPVLRAVPGRSGRAAGYADEPVSAA